VVRNIWSIIHIASDEICRLLLLIVFTTDVCLKICPPPHSSAPEALYYFSRIHLSVESLWYVISFLCTVHHLYMSLILRNVGHWCTLYYIALMLLMLFLLFTFLSFHVEVPYYFPCITVVLNAKNVMVCLHYCFCFHFLHKCGYTNCHTLYSLYYTLPHSR
jgi:hypothetical protein